MDIDTSEAIERLGERIDALEISLRGQMAAQRDDLRGEFRDGLAENRRHTQVLFESLRDDIRMQQAGMFPPFARMSAEAV